MCRKVIGFSLLLVIIRSFKKKKPRHFFIQSKLRPNPVVPRAFSRALCQALLRVLIGLIVFKIIIKFPYNARSNWLKQRALSEIRKQVDDI